MLPSYTLVREHVEKAMQIALMDNENFSLYDKFYQHQVSWENHADLLDLCKKTANGWHVLAQPVQDFIKDTTPPLLRAGRRVMEFWKEFKVVAKLPYYANLDGFQCWNPYELP